MLSKLIKYDIRSTWRDFIAVYLSILLAVLILPQLMNRFNNEIIVIITGFVAAAIVIATVVIMITMLFKIFNSGVFSKKGYLTMTLPVTPTQILVSKLLVSTMWIILTGIAAVAGVAIYLLGVNMTAMAVFSAEFREILSVIGGGHGIFTALLLLVTMLFSTVKEVAKIFLACSVAHLKQLNRFRVLLGILSYFVLSWAEVLIVQVAALILSLFPVPRGLVHQIMILNDTGNFYGMTGIFNGVIAVGILYSLVLIVLYGLGTVAILDRKLDLN